MNLVKRSAFVAVVLIAMLVLVPSALAVDGPGLEFSELEWVVPCESAGGLFLYHVAWTYPAGYRIEYNLTSESASLGSYSEHNTWTEDSGFGGEYYDVEFVPPDGYTRITLVVWAPSGLVVTSSELYGECPSGLLRSPNFQIYGIQQPPSSARVNGYVLVDTPLYTEADPATVRTEVLTAGQTWFVVGAKTGTDGQQWYEVFVGGWNTVYVPASVMSLDGPLPQ
jgi:hypothetical protein